MYMRKMDEDRRLVTGEVYIPNMLDTDGQYMSVDTVRDMAHQFMIDQHNDNVNADHKKQNADAIIVESFIAKSDDTIFIPNSWVCTAFVQDLELWERVKSGHYGGFSLEGKGDRRLVKRALEILVPIGEQQSRTTFNPDHDHEYVFTFSEDGKTVTGHTLPDDTGHTHKIVRGTKTQMTKGHAHGTDYMRFLRPVQDAA